MANIIYSRAIEPHIPFRRGTTPSSNLDWNISNSRISSRPVNIRRPVRPHQATTVKKENPRVSVESEPTISPSLSSMRRTSRPMASLGRFQQMPNPTGTPRSFLMRGQGLVSCRRSQDHTESPVLHKPLPWHRSTPPRVPIASPARRPSNKPSSRGSTSFSPAPPPPPPSETLKIYALSAPVMAVDLNDTQEVFSLSSPPELHSKLPDSVNVPALLLRRPSPDMHIHDPGHDQNLDHHQCQPFPSRGSASSSSPTRLTPTSTIASPPTPIVPAVACPPAFAMPESAVPTAPIPTPKACASPRGHLADMRQRLAIKESQMKLQLERLGAQFSMIHSGIDAHLTTRTEPALPPSIPAFAPPMKMKPIPGRMAVPALSLAAAKAIVREETEEGAKEIDYGLEAKLISERLQTTKAP